jgi:hypothetical protein
MDIMHRVLDEISHLIEKMEVPKEVQIPFRFHQRKQVKTKKRRKAKSYPKQAGLE